jgi:peptidoglycan L-alanyl-D-glutamate endopeptidase CwlK|tara:strand:- start:4481 stop:4858 length:378 start_codon:yes stop_codon:yes gene_type:complete
MAYKLGTRSLQNLSGVNPDMVAVVSKAIEITEVDFTVIEGIRNINRQRELVKAGKSTTLNSRHLTGHAVDMVPYPVDWEDIDRFELMAEAMKEAAEELDIPIVWGGDWKSFYDAPHFELDRKKYP